MKRPRRIALALVVMGWIWAGCLADPFTGATVTLDLLADMDPSGLVRMPDGSSTHYELWVEFADDGVLSIGKFWVDSSLQVLDYPSGEPIGSVTIEDPRFRLSGVRWTSPSNLTNATETFITAEPNGETDIAPTGFIIQSGLLLHTAKGELRGEMTGQYVNVLGDVRNPESRITIIIAEDNVSF